MGKELEPDELQIIVGTANPAGSVDSLFLLCGNAVSGPVQQITAAGESDAPPTSSPNRPRKLRIFHFNDLHNNLTDLSGDTKGTHRFSQMVKRVDDAREKAGDDEAVLFISIGDDHTGTGFDELMGWSEEQFTADASYRAYSAAGVDCSVLGNHEFDRGSLLLSKGIGQDAEFPILSANVHSSAHLKPGEDYHPAAIMVCKGLRVGLIGLTTRVETRVGQPGDLSLAVASPVDTISNILPALSPHVDVVLILSHCGYGDGQYKSGKAAAIRDIGEADFAIARAARPLTDKPLFVLGGHTHTVINESRLEDSNVFDGVPVLQAGAKGSHLGEMVLDFPAVGVCDVSKVGLHAIKPANGAECEQPGDYDQEFEAEHIAPLIAQIDETLKHKIATVSTDELSWKHAVLDRYAGESALLNFICDAIHARMVEATYKVDFALLNGATVLSGVEPGQLTLEAWFDVMPYADQVFIVTMSGAELEAILHNNAKRILRNDEIDRTDYHAFLPRGFLHTSHHIRYGIEPGSSVADACAHSIVVNGEPISSLIGQDFNVAMPTYLALGAFGERWNGETISGGVPGDLPGFDIRAMPATNTGQIFRNQISAQIQKTGIIDNANGSFRDGRVKIFAEAEV